MNDRLDHVKSRTSLLLGAIIAAGLTAVAPVRAEPINVTAERGVIVGDLAHGNFYGADSPSSAIGTFSDSVTQTLGGPHVNWKGEEFETHQTTIASQDSIIAPGPGLFAGTGDASIGFSVLDSDLVYAKSFFDVSFDITNNHSYTLTGKLTANMDGGKGVASFALDGPSPLMFQKANYGADLILNSVGTLAAGHYHLVISALVSPSCEPALCTSGSWMGGGTSFDVNFQMTAAIPEPETYAMLLAGLGLLGFVARRRKQTAD